MTNWDKIIIRNSNIASKDDCFLKYAVEQPATDLVHCNATWDSIFCWPPTPSNHIVAVPCAILISPNGSIEGEYNESILAYRICDSNGQWAWGNWTNYNDCMPLLETLDEYNPEEHNMTQYAVTWIMFLGSLISLILLLISLSIFCYFRSLHCSRLSVHKNLIIALIMKVLTMVIITEPYITNRKIHLYRNVDWLCKFILVSKMYSTMASVNWMFNEGFYLHSRITVSIFDSKAPFKALHLIGWGLPVLFVGIWAFVLESNHKMPCWKGYGNTPYIWILTLPITIALTINLIFLINIVRILVTKLRRNHTLETDQIRKAAKATAVLFPLLGLTNILFFVNPKDSGPFEKAYMVTNAFLQSSQGILVAALFCFLNRDVSIAVRKLYYRKMKGNNNISRYSKRSIRTSSGLYSDYVTQARKSSILTGPSPSTRKPFVYRSSRLEFCLHNWASNSDRNSNPFNQQLKFKSSETYI